MLRCKLTAVGREYNYIIVIAQSNEIYKKKKKKLSEFARIKTGSGALIVTT